MNVTFLEKTDEGLFTEIDLEVYSISALLRVAYKFTDRCFVHICYPRAKIAEVRFRSKNAETDLELIAGEFCNEILDQRLREIVTRESEPTRNLLMAHALSRSALSLERAPILPDELAIIHPQNDPRP